MKKHTGMRPHDIVVLLKIVTMGDGNWYGKDLAQQLFISNSEISESLNRSAIAGLLSQDKKKVMKKSLIEFLEYGLPYVFPTQPGAITRGVATAHAAPPLNSLISSSEGYVWPSATGSAKGQALEPLHQKVPEACKADQKLWELLALADALRIGRVRERKLAVEELSKRVLS